MPTGPSWAEAELEARSVVEVSPEFGQGWLLLGDALLAQEKTRDIEELIRKIETGIGGDWVPASPPLSVVASLTDASEGLAGELLVLLQAASSMTTDKK